MTYEKIKWKVPGLFKTDPEAVFKELQTLEERTPDAIVDLARNSDSVLHSMFDWDDEVAAEKWRKQQARIISCNLIVETREQKGEVIELRLMHVSEEKKSYEEINYFVEHENEYAKLLKRAKMDLNSFKTKYHILKELSPIFEAIDVL